MFSVFLLVFGLIKFPLDGKPCSRHCEVSREHKKIKTAASWKLQPSGRVEARLMVNREQWRLGVRETYFGYHGPEGPLQGGDLGVGTPDPGKDMPDRGTSYCKGLGQEQAW